MHLQHCPCRFQILGVIVAMGIVILSQTVWTLNCHDAENFQEIEAVTQRVHVDRFPFHFQACADRGSVTWRAVLEEHAINRPGNSSARPLRVSSEVERSNTPAME